MAIFQVLLTPDGVQASGDYKKVEAASEKEAAERLANCPLSSRGDPKSLRAIAKRLGSLGDPVRFFEPPTPGS
jgi:hypothetical protein